MTTTFGPAMLYVPGSLVPEVTKDDGTTTHLIIREELKPNIVKHTQSSDLSNMFKTGEIKLLTVGDIFNGM